MVNEYFLMVIKLLVLKHKQEGKRKSAQGSIDTF